MSSFSLFCIAVLAGFGFVGWRVGWINQLLWYALFGLYISGALLLFDGIEQIYTESGVPTDLAGMTSLITLVTFSALLVYPSLRLHSTFYERKEIEEPYRRALGFGLGFVLGVLVIFLVGESILRYDLVDPFDEEYQSIGLRLIRVIVGD